MALTQQERSRRYREAHREELRERQRRVRASDPVAAREKDRIRNARYRDARNARYKAAYAADPGIHAARAKARREENPELFREYKRRYYSSDRGKLVNRASAHRRRLQKAGNSATVEQISVILAAKRCYLCGGRFTKGNPATIEHVIALCEGGTNDAANLAAAHLSCNCRKQRRHLNPHTGQGILI